MSRHSDNRNPVLRVTICIVFVLIIAGLIGGLLYRAIGSRGTTEYINYNDIDYSAETESDITLQAQDNIFSVKSATGGMADYSVKIVANSENNFEFVMDGQTYNFISADENNNDYTSVFGVSEYADYFVVNIPDDFTVEGAVESVYGKDIEILDELNSSYCYFTIVITLGGNSINLNFNFAEQISLEPPYIVV